MINNSVFENQIIRYLWKIVNEQDQLLIHYHKGEPDNYVKGRLLYIQSIHAEIRKTINNSGNESSKVGIG